MGATSGSNNQPVCGGTAEAGPAMADPDNHASHWVAEVHKDRFTLTVVRYANGADEFLAFPSETSPFLLRLRKDGRLQDIETREFEYINLPAGINSTAQFEKLRSLHHSNSKPEVLCIVTIVGHYRSFFATAILARRGEFLPEEQIAISRDLQASLNFDETVPKPHRPATMRDRWTRFWQGRGIGGDKP